LRYKFALPKYDINKLRFVGLKYMLQGSRLCDFRPELAVLQGTTTTCAYSE
jgi:hypothetical protein